MDASLKSIPMDAFDAMIAEAYRLDEEIEAYKRDFLKPKEARLFALEGKILEVLTAQERSSYKSPSGTVIRQNRYSVQTPKTVEQKQAFFGWLRAKSEDVMWQYTTVNSQSLNALYKQEFEIAKEEGNLDFALPGIGEPTLMTSLARRKR